MVSGSATSQTLREFIEWARGDWISGSCNFCRSTKSAAIIRPYNAISAMAIEPMTLHLAPGSPEELTQEAFERRRLTRI